MDQGRRHLRNTVFVLYGLTALYFGVNRLQAATVNAGAPQWLSGAASLGLASVTTLPRETSYVTELALRDFTRLHVAGRFTVEIIGASDRSLSFTAADGTPLPLNVRQDGDLLRVRAVTGTSTPETAVLRIEAPALAQIEARLLTGLTLRGLQSPQLRVALDEVATVRLVESRISHLTLHSDLPMDVKVDRATLAAGRLKTSGDLAVLLDE